MIIGSTPHPGMQSSQMMWFRSGSLTNNIRFLVVTVTRVCIQHGQLCRFHRNGNHPMVLGYHYFVEKTYRWGIFSNKDGENNILNKEHLGESESIYIRKGKIRHSIRKTEGQITTHIWKQTDQKKISSFLQIGHLLLNLLVITAHQAVKFYFPKLQQRLNSSSPCNSDLVRASAKTSAPRMTTMLLASFSGCPNLKICGVAWFPEVAISESVVI